MSNRINLKRGYDIQIVGEAKKELIVKPNAKLYSVYPSDLKGVTPKLCVEVGTEVKAGTPLFFLKNQPEVMVTSPVSGEIVEINRGAKRVIENIRILADEKISYENFDLCSVNDSAEKIKSVLTQSGAWTLIKQRPFDRIADTDKTPKAIFVSGFDSAPLAPDLNFALQGKEKYLQAAVYGLNKLTQGKFYLSLKEGENNSSFEKLEGVQINYFKGPHPAGNVGVQIHHLNPINKGEVVWTINAQDLATIGKLFSEGVYAPERVISLAGSEIKNPAYHTLRLGEQISEILTDNLQAGDVRIISGSVLFGDKVDSNGYLGYYSQQVTAIPEGNEPEFLGWLIPSYPRPSISKTFLSFLTPKKKYKVNTSMHGEERAYVVTGEYEKVFPMNIFPVHLVKACLAQDLEAMEALGIYEVAEEDFALCEFVCTSKLPVQEIIGEGLALIEKEG
jgi:Na+-transporting NADH:ubiquinone oxidoreductase subunit A